MPTVRTFDDEKALSESPEAHDLVLRHLTQRFPGALTICKAAPDNDKLGADYWIEFPHGQHRAIDVKVRRQDWGVNGKPDIALEVWSNVEQQTPGWALDANKLTDYLLCVWLDTGRANLFDFRLLRAVTQANLSAWQARFETARQQTGIGSRGYTSRALFIPGRELHAAIYRWQTEAI